MLAENTIRSRSAVENKLHPSDLEWVTQVSFLRPGFLLANGYSLQASSSNERDLAGFRLDGCSLRQAALIVKRQSLRLSLSESQQAATQQ
jgi:hypothetical protein